MTTLTTAKLDAALAAMGMKPKPQVAAFVVTPAVMEAIRRQGEIRSTPLPTARDGLLDPVLMGAPVFEKPRQHQDCYAFNNLQTARDYADGKFTEAHLIHFLATQPNATTATTEDILAALAADSKTDA